MTSSPDLCKSITDVLSLPQFRLITGPWHNVLEALFCTMPLLADQQVQPPKIYCSLQRLLHSAFAKCMQDMCAFGHHLKSSAYSEAQLACELCVPVRHCMTCKPWSDHSHRLHSRQSRAAAHTCQLCRLLLLIGRVCMGAAPEQAARPEDHGGSGRDDKHHGGCSAQGLDLGD